MASQDSIRERPKSALGIPEFDLERFERLLGVPEFDLERAQKGSWRPRIRS